MFGQNLRELQTVTQTNPKHSKQSADVIDNQPQLTQSDYANQPAETNETTDKAMNHPIHSNESIPTAPSTEIDDWDSRWDDYDVNDDRTATEEDNQLTSLEDEDPYSLYERWYDPEWEDGTLPVQPEPQNKPIKSDAEIVRELADEAVGLEGGLNTSYEPSEYEAEWLIESMHPFFELEYITDITGQVKGGKEASVYRCIGHELSGYDLLAAKVYRPRKFRNLSNDKMYREGRSILQADGGAAKANDDRLLRAIGKRTAYGAQASHVSWLMHEFNTLSLLHAEGAAVPKPLATSGNAILMEYVGSTVRGAPTLHEVSLEKDEAKEVFDEVFRNIDLMLQLGLIHGDLSAYNILYWEGKVTLIDFPQVSESEKNSNARFILDRDVQRVCDYFQRQGLRVDAKSLARKLWDRYAYYNQDDELATFSRWVESVEAEE